MHRALLRLASGRTVLGWTVASWLLISCAAFSALAQTRYIAFGDSITEGTGDDDDRQEKGYPPRLEDMLQEAGRDAVVENRGVGGEKTPEGLTRLDEVLLDGGDAVLLMEGSNDISRSISVETTLFNLSEMARKAEDAGWETVQVTVIPRIPRANVDRNNILNQQLNQGIRDQAGSRGRRLVDNFEVFGRVEGVFDLFYWDGPDDRVGHPNAAGYDLMAEAFFDVLTGADTVAPVTGLMSPDNGDEEVPASAVVEVDVWDFGTGIDVGSTRLVVGGVEVRAAPSGDDRLVEFRYQGNAPLRGVVEVVLRSQDLAVPANAVDRQVARFVIAGTEFLAGDLDEDGRVDGSDLVRFAVAFGAAEGEARYRRGTDLNGDGVIDGEDLAILASNFGQSSF